MKSKIDIASEVLMLPKSRVESIVSLIEGGATLPFMARYRKEVTGGMDELELGRFIDEWKRLSDVDKRRTAIIKSLTERDLLTDELLENLNGTWDIARLEDIYLPFKPKRKSKADAAIELGLLPVAKQLMAQKNQDLETVVRRAMPNGVAYEDALSGASDIIAEWVNERIALRNSLRKSLERYGLIQSKKKRGVDESDAETQVFRDYLNFDEPIKRIPSHRFLAIERGVNKGVLSMSTVLDAQTVENAMEHYIVKGHGEVSDFVFAAAMEAWKRLLHPSLSTEVLAQLREKSQEAAIDVFETNLEPLLLQPPIGGVRTLAIDPGFRTGCKVVCLDEHGTLLHNENIYPHPPQKEWGAAQKKIKSLVGAYQIEAVAIGNGTAGRETEQFVKSIRFDRELRVFVVNEDGASIYSASKLAREEFPDKDVTVRGAVSIGRRLQDPLAELVKIEPQHIGVGQYQHDLDAKRLEERLGRVVEKCVNSVGIELNSASHTLLSHIAGIGPALSKSIVEYRTATGGFTSRKELLKVPRLGASAYEQAAGFLRVSESSEVLDHTGVHPERYALVKQMAADAKVSIADLVKDKLLIDSIDLKKYVSSDVGLPTLQDIVSELKQPGRDPRGAAKVLEFANISTMSDLNVGMELPGMVTNLTDFGAFVDIGIKENGLIHISRLKDGYVAHPSDVLSVQDHVLVRVEEVDEARKRIGLRLLAKQ